jgi:subtilisin family serine protease
MLEENDKHSKRWDPYFHNLRYRNLVQKTLTFGVLSLLLLSTTMILAPAPQQSAMAQPTPSPAPTPAPAAPPASGQTPQIPQIAPQLQAVPQLSPESSQTQRSVPQLLERSVANLPNIPPNTQPAGQPIPGQFIVILKTPATIPTGLAAQQTIRTLEQQADTLTSQIDNVASPDINVTNLGTVGALVITSESASQGASPQGLTSQGVAPSAGSPNATGTTPELRQVVQRLEANPNVQDVVQDITVNVDQAQILPAGENRKDADWTPRPGRAGDRIDTVNADIAILDTGVQANHPDLTVFRCVGFGYANCADGNGHGTHVAGIAAARDNNIGVVGSAPGARIWAVKVLSDQGTGSFADILAGIDYVLTNRAQIEAVNLSLGATGTFLPAENALRTLAASGVTVAVSAGNNGQNANGNTPARAGLGFNGVITVSAYGDSDGRCGGFGPATSRGPDDSYAPFSAFNVDIAASGVDILSTYRNSGYARMSGTSMSSPDVAGAAAYYKSLFPAMTPAQIELALKLMGTKPGTGNGLFPCDGHGRGYVRTSPQHTEPLLYMGLTGVYNANDGGRYYIRQNGPLTIYWAGLSGGGAGTAFTNIFKGTAPASASPSTTFAGQWCDVPRGTILSCGTLSIRMTSPTTFARIGDGGYLGSFGGSQWTKLP